MKVSWVGGLPILCCIGSLALAAEEDHVSSSDPRSLDDTYRRLAVFAEVLDYLENGYMGQVQGGALIDAAIDGMVEKTDVRSRYLPIEDHQRAIDRARDVYCGIGVELVRVGKQTRVVKTVPDSPASQHGLRPGEHLVAIDGRPVRSLSMAEVVARLRGAPGTTVRLEVWGPLEGRRREVRLHRAWLHPTPVSARRFRDDVGYIRISAFDEGTADEVRMWRDGFRRQPGLRGLILDLRENPGGRLAEAVRVADFWVGRGVLLRIQRRHGSEEESMAHEQGTDLETPLVVLVDGGTASAAEVVAGALQDHRRATLVGSRTFGKSSVQTFITLADGSALKLTVGTYRTAGRELIHGRGIEPDFPVPDAIEPLFDRVVADGETRLDRDPALVQALLRLPEALD